MSQPPQLLPETARSYLAQIGDALRAAHEGAKVPSDALVWPAGLNRSIIHWLPVSVRTWNCFERERLTDGSGPLRAADLLRRRSFGRISLNDLLFTVENFLLEHAGNDGASSSHPRQSTDAESGDSGAASVGVPTQAETRLSTWNHVRESLAPLLATSAELLGTRTLADAMHPEVLRLASRMKLTPTLDAIRIHDIVERTQNLPELIAVRLHRTLETTSERQRTVIRARLLQAPPATLEEVGLRLGVTRERVRQIQARLEDKIRRALGEELGVIARTLGDRLDRMVPQTDLDRRIEDVVPNESAIVCDLFRKALISAMGFTLHDGIYLDEQATKVLGDVRTAARARADDVGPCTRAATHRDSSRRGMATLLAVAARAQRSPLRSRHAGVSGYGEGPRQGGTDVDRTFRNPRGNCSPVRVRG